MGGVGATISTPEGTPDPRSAATRWPTRAVFAILCRQEGVIDEHASFGAGIRRRRKALDLTQTEVAERVGCALGTIRKIETDERRPSKHKWERPSLRPRGSK